MNSLKLKLSRTGGSSPLRPRILTPLILASLILLVIVIPANAGIGAGDVRAQEDDRHGDTFATATYVPLDSYVEGRIDPANDTDLFVFDLRDQSGPTDVWIYLDGDFDSIGGLFDSSGNLVIYNDDSRVEGRWSSFHIRAILQPDYYFILVRSYRRAYTGSYTLYVESVAPTGISKDTPTILELGSPVAGKFDARGETRYYRLDFAETTELYLSVRNPSLRDADGEPLPVAPIDPTVLDSSGDEVRVNVGPRFDSHQGDYFRYGFVIQDEFAPGTYYLEIDTPADDYETVYPIFYTVNAFEDTYYPGFIEYCTDLTASLDRTAIDDPLYGCQWHLDQPDGPFAGEDINVEPAWAAGLTGEGVTVAVVDDGMDWRHEDLSGNADSSLNYDYSGGDEIYHPYAHHGTSVAGVIASRDNDVGVRGVAPRATIYGHNLLHDTATGLYAYITYEEEADAMARSSDVTAISNNSWGAASRAGLAPAGALWELAVENAVNSGYGGKGTLYVFSAGNGHTEGGDANLDEIANFYAVTPVCAVNEAGTRSWYSEMGVNLWICAPSSHPRTEENYRGIVTLDNSDRYTSDFGGTSSAAPTVSGVAALVREANPTLTWRDVKLILAASARKNDPANPGWQDGATKYRSASDRYHFSREYGFGVVDAAAAVDLAGTWTNLPTMMTATAHSARSYTLIPDAPGDRTVTLTLDIDSDIEFTEFVEIDTSFQHNSFRDLDIELESPSGAVSKIIAPFDTLSDEDPSIDYVPLRYPFRFGSARHLGEDPNGVWTLRITDRFNLGGGGLEWWDITVYGHGREPAPADNVAPIFAPDGRIIATTTRSVAENTPAGAAVGDPVAATDTDALTYTLGGPDAALFDIDAATGQIAVGAETSLDYETRAAYTVTVTATDPYGVSAEITVTVAVTDVSLGALGDRYDVDHNERIDSDEVLSAVRDYFAGLITADEALEIVSLYFAG